MHVVDGGACLLCSCFSAMTVSATARKKKFDSYLSCVFLFDQIWSPEIQLWLSFESPLNNDHRCFKNNSKLNIRWSHLIKKELSHVRHSAQICSFLCCEQVHNIRYNNYGGCWNMPAVSLIFDILLCFSFGSHFSRVQLRINYPLVLNNTLMMNEVSFKCIF